MRFHLRFSLGLAAALTVVLAAAFSAAPGPTYNRDVRPIFEKSCISCHSPGHVAPMPFNSYENTRPWARQIKAVVTQQKMPPAVVQKHYGLFGDDGTLSRHEIDVIVQWVDAGAPEGGVQEAGRDHVR